MIDCRFAALKNTLKKVKIMKKTLFLIVTLLLADEWICPSCGNTADGNFCNNCGTKKPEDTTSTWICTNCGNNAQGNFCSNCGSPRPTNESAANYVDLGSMEIFIQTSENSKKDDLYLTDNYGNTYTHSVSVYQGSLTYLLRSQYSTFTGTVAYPKGIKRDANRASAALYIYGDDQLIAKFEEVGEDSRPQEFNIDIQPYEKIKLEWSCKGFNVWKDWGYYATIFDGKLIPVK